MKHYASLLFIFLLLSSVIVLAQDTEDMVVKQEKKVETEEERVVRMLDAFDRSNVEPGRIVVSFTSITNKQQAARILENVDLRLATTKVCMSVVNPGEEPQDQVCSVLDEWNDRLKIATAIVPAGLDVKELALELYRHKDVEWIEPSYTSTIDAGDDTMGIDDGNRPPRSFQQEPLGSLGGALRDELNVFERFWQWFRGLFN